MRWVFQFASDMLSHCVEIFFFQAGKELFRKVRSKKPPAGVSSRAQASSLRPACTFSACVQKHGEEGEGEEKRLQIVKRNHSVYF